MKMPKLPWQRRESVAANLETALPALVRDFFGRGRQAAQAEKPEELHQFRLAAKQFRYTLEFLKPAYDDSLAGYIDGIKKLQDYLGDINDCVTTRELLEGEQTEEAGRLRQYLERHQVKRTADFRKFWRGQFDSSEVEEQWVRYLRAAQKQ